MNFKFLYTLLAVFVLTSSVANAGIIYDFDFSDVDTSDAERADGSLEGLIFSFEFDNSTDFNDFNLSNLLAWTVTYNNDTQVLGKLYAGNEATLFSQVGDDLFLTLGAGDPASMSSRTTTSDFFQLGRNSSVSLYTEFDGSYTYFHSDVSTWSIKGIVNEVPEPTTLAIFALGLIGLTCRRLKNKPLSLK